MKLLAYRIMNLSILSNEANDWHCRSSDVTRPSWNLNHFAGNQSSISRIYLSVAIVKTPPLKATKPLNACFTSRPQKLEKRIASLCENTSSNWHLIARKGLRAALSKSTKISDWRGRMRTKRKCPQLVPAQGTWGTWGKNSGRTNVTLRRTHNDVDVFATFPRHRWLFPPGESRSPSETHPTLVQEKRHFSSLLTLGSS